MARFELAQVFPACVRCGLQESDGFRAFVAARPQQSALRYVPGDRTREGREQDEDKGRREEREQAECDDSRKTHALDAMMLYARPVRPVCALPDRGAGRMRGVQLEGMRGRQGLPCTIASPEPRASVLANALSPFAGTSPLRSWHWRR